MLNWEWKLSRSQMSPMSPFSPRLTPVAEWDFATGTLIRTALSRMILQDLHPLQDLSLGNLDLLKEFPVLQGQDMDARDVPARIPDARPFEAEFRPLQRMVQDQDLPGARLHAGPGHRGDDQGMGRRGEIGASWQRTCWV